MSHYPEEYEKDLLNYRTQQGLYDMKDAMAQRKKGDITASDVQRRERENALIRQTEYDKMIQEGRAEGIKLGTTCDRNKPFLYDETQNIKNWHKPTKPSNDPVSSPNHYLKLGYECIEIIASSLSKEAFKGYCMGNFLKYRFRMGDKDAMQQDFDKSKEYLMLYDKYSHLCKDIPF
jgi:hypothetical protein